MCESDCVRETDKEKKEIERLQMIQYANLITGVSKFVFFQNKCLNKI